MVFHPVLSGVKHVVEVLAHSFLTLWGVYS